MLHRYSEVIRSALLATDMILVGAAWVLAFYLRFYLPGMPVPPIDEIPSFEAYAVLLPGILPLWFWLFRSRGLYEAQRTHAVVREAGAVIAATAAGVMILVAVTFFARSYFYSRLVIGIFAVLSASSVILARASARVLMKQLRRRGYNLRYVLIVGAGPLAEQVIERLEAHPEAGLRVLGLASEDARRKVVRGVPVVAGYGQIKEYVASHRVDQVIVALQREESHQLEKILSTLDDELPSVQLVPDLGHVLTLRSTVEDLEGLPVISLRDTPFVGMAAVWKRAFDVTVAATLLLLLAPVLAGIALAVRATMGSPILYRQERMGLDGHVFSMIKFRTMDANAEGSSGPVWARAEDPRRTRLGSFLRRTSLDELPQFWNVLRGEMSIVGPRPERPVFIEQFRHDVPGYMLRHKVKAGVTGWAQVNGWRGNTSLNERIEHDIFYIQNWSLGLDARIVALTVLQMLFGRNAH